MARMHDEYHLGKEININDQAFSIKEILIKMDTKIDGVQSFMNKLYEIFVTQSEMNKHLSQHERDLAEVWTALKEEQKERGKLTMKAAFITGIGVCIGFFKDAIMNGLFSNFK